MRAGELRTYLRAEARILRGGLIAALKRCATQKQNLFAKINLLRGKPPGRGALRVDSGPELRHVSLGSTERPRRPFPRGPVLERPAQQRRAHGETRAHRG